MTLPTIQKLLPEAFAVQDALLETWERDLPAGQDDPRVCENAEARRQLVRAWLVEHDLDSLLISRRDNFAWLTIGGDNHVLKNTELGAGHLLITRDRHYLLSYSMDNLRILEEEIPGQGYEPVYMHWYEGDPRQLAAALGGRRIAADTLFPGTQDMSIEIGRLHSPLTVLEFQRARWLGRQSALLLEAVAGWVRPGMLEVEIARAIRAVYALYGMELDVVLTGSDARLGKYWHALPSRKPVEKHFSMHPAARRWGLYANVNRAVCFGSPPEQLRRAYQAAPIIEGRVLGMLAPGLPYAEILEKQKSWYAELGYPEEWKGHFQGGLTGYQIGDPTRCFTGLNVECNQSFDWFITVQGIQVEELSILTAADLEIASLGERWPRLTISGEVRQVAVPDLLVLS